MEDWRQLYLTCKKEKAGKMDGPVNRAKTLFNSMGVRMNILAFDIDTMQPNSTSGLIEATLDDLEGLKYDLIKLQTVLYHISHTRHNNMTTTGGDPATQNEGLAHDPAEKQITTPCPKCGHYAENYFGHPQLCPHQEAEKQGERL